MRIAALYDGAAPAAKSEDEEEVAENAGDDFLGSETLDWGEKIVTPQDEV